METLRVLHICKSRVATPFFSLFSFLFSLFFSSSSFAQEWQEVKGDHFIVYYLNETAQPKEIIRKAELYYNRIADDLGYARYSNFWQWENRVKIYIHPSKEAFQKSTGQPAWSHGMASYLDKSIHTIETNPNFFEEVLPHEIAHLVFRDFVGFKGDIPLWMDDGVAQWEEADKRQLALDMMPDLVATGRCFTLERMMTMDIRSETDAQKVGLFYTQAISMVDFLIKTYGPSAFTDFCRELRDGKKIQEALQAAYPGSLSSIEDMENRWREYLKVASKGASQEAGPLAVLSS